MSRYLRTSASPATETRPPALVIDVQGFDYDRSEHSDGTTLLVKDVTAEDLRGLVFELQLADLIS